MRKNKVRMTRRVNPPTAAVAMTRICPCSAAISEAEREAQRKKVDAASITREFCRMDEINFSGQMLQFVCNGFLSA